MEFFCAYLSDSDYIICKLFLSLAKEMKNVKTLIYVMHAFLDVLIMYIDMYVYRYVFIHNMNFSGEV